MTQSMTAFARTQGQWEGHLVCWELRSVNHRYLEVSFRLPELCRDLEMDLRQTLRHQVHRGKLECQLKVTCATEFGSSLQINSGLVTALLEAGTRLASTQHIANDLTVSHVLAWPGVALVGQPDASVLGASIKQLFQKALDELMVSRGVEGDLLKELITARLEKLNEEIRLARAEAYLSAEQTKEKLLARLQHLRIDAQEGRFEQEMTLMLFKLDVSEELDRIDTHLKEVTRTLECDKIAGRRLDFLMQELHREANTLSSKSDSARLTQHAVEMKVLIEQMREQIQNIE
jgi:uncharacterized protein (TIGR00255 family)